MESGHVARVGRFKEDLGPALSVRPMIKPLPWVCREARLRESVDDGGVGDFCQVGDAHLRVEEPVRRDPRAHPIEAFESDATENAREPGARPGGPPRQVAATPRARDSANCAGARARDSVSGHRAGMIRAVVFGGGAGGAG